MICHLQWKVKLKKFLEGRGDFDIAELSPINCQFGTWLQSDEIARYASPTEIREIHKLHTTVHEKAKRVYDLKMSGQNSYAAQQFQEIEVTSMKLVALLTILKVMSDN